MLLDKTRSTCAAYLQIILLPQAVDEEPSGLDSSRLMQAIGKPVCLSQALSVTGCACPHCWPGCHEVSAARGAS